MAVGDVCAGVDWANDAHEAVVQKTAMASGCGPRRSRTTRLGWRLFRVW
jgi:hypothetical protein